jgi:broad specificity phosphatase PhoE
VVEATFKRSRPALLILARHGESLYNRVKGSFPHYPDTPSGRRVTNIPEHRLPLTRRGRVQARRLGLHLHRTFGRFDKVYDSGYTRAVQTRQLALEAAYTPEEVAAMRPRSELLLRERENGLIRNMPPAVAARAVPMYDLWERQFQENPFLTRFPCGESVADVADRLRQFRALLIEHHAGEAVLVFCHSVVMKAMRVLLLREDVEQAIGTCRAIIRNTGIDVYRSSVTGWVCDHGNPNDYPADGAESASP